MLLNWDINNTKKDLLKAFANNSELELLQALKANSFLFYELFFRKHGIYPIFHEVEFGNTYRCDFAWVNPNSSGPEWVLVEVEKPKMRLFNKDNTPSSELHKAIEQINSWGKYFLFNPLETRRIFGYVAKFRYILVTGTGVDWSETDAKKWRIHFHSTSPHIEIISCDTFLRSLDLIKDKPEDFWSFNENPVTLSGSELEDFWRTEPYFDRFRSL